MSGQDEGRDWTKRRLGSVIETFGSRVNVSWDPKSGRNVRVEVDDQYPCEGDTPDADGWCRDPQAVVLNLAPDEADELAALLSRAASENRTFFAAEGDDAPPASPAPGPATGGEEDSRGR
jgi:hypothetical protein